MRWGARVECRAGLGERAGQRAGRWPRPRARCFATFATHHPEHPLAPHPHARGGCFRKKPVKGPWRHPSTQQPNRCPPPRTRQVLEEEVVDLGGPVAHRGVEVAPRQPRVALRVRTGRWRGRWSGCKRSAPAPRGRSRWRTPLLHVDGEGGSQGRGRAGASAAASGAGGVKVAARRPRAALLWWAAARGAGRKAGCRLAASQPQRQLQRWQQQQQRAPQHHSRSGSSSSRHRSSGGSRGGSSTARLAPRRAGRRAHRGQLHELDDDGGEVKVVLRGRWRGWAAGRRSKQAVRGPRQSRAGGGEVKVVLCGWRGWAGRRRGTGGLQGEPAVHC